MSTCDFKNEEDTPVLGISLQMLSLSSNLSSSFDKENCDNKTDTELPKPRLSLSRCTESDILPSMKIPNLNKGSSLKEDSKEDKKIIDVTIFFSELSVSFKKSDHDDDDDGENKVAITIQARGKFPLNNSNSQAFKPYNRPHDNKGLFKNLLHLSGGTICCLDSNNTNHFIEPVNVNTNIEIIHEDSSSSVPEYSCTSPESGYGSQGSVSSPNPTSSPFSTSEFLLSKELEDALNVQKLIPKEKTAEVLDDIVELISEEGLRHSDHSNSNCGAKVTYIAPIWLVTVINCPPLPTNVKHQHAICPKESNTDAFKNDRRNLLKCHLNTDEIERIAKDIYLRKRDETRNDRKKVIFIDNQKTKRTNLHIAVKKEQLEHVYCLVEIQMQFSREWGDAATAFNLTDTSGNTALNYANAVKTEKKSALVAYLEKAGAKLRPKKKRGN